MYIYTYIQIYAVQIKLGLSGARQREGKDKAKAVHLLAVDALNNAKELVSNIWITLF